MSILDEKKFHHEISITPVFNIHASLHVFLACIFCQSLGHQIDNCSYQSSRVLFTQIVLMNHRPYLVSLLVQSLVLNVLNSVYPLTLQNVACRESIIPHVSIPLPGNVMEQNLVGYPNSMYPHVGPYTPYFGYVYEGIMSVFTMWPPKSDPLTNPTTPPKLVLGIAQIGIVTDQGELLEDDDYFKRKHNPRMPLIILTRKSYHEWRGKPSLIGDVGRPPTGGRAIPINNGGGGPFGSGGYGPLRGGGNGPLGGGSSGPLGD